MRTERVKPQSASGLNSIIVGNILLSGMVAFISAVCCVVMFGFAMGSLCGLIVGVASLGYAAFDVSKKRDEKVLFDGNWVSTKGTVDQWVAKENKSNYGVAIKYYLYFSFATGSTSDVEGSRSPASRIVRLKALVDHDEYMSPPKGAPIAVRYSASRPELALKEGEW